VTRHGSRPIVCRVDGTEPEPEQVEAASRLLSAGQLVVLPTDTGYALAGVASDEAVLERVCSSKGRDPRRPLHVMVASLKQAEELVHVEPRARVLFERLMPGPLTLVLPARAGVPEGLNRSGGTIGIRIPDLHYTLEVLARLGAPLTATSANPSGGPTPFTSRELAICASMPGVAAIFDAGDLPHRRASTIVELLPGAEPVLLREGPMELFSIQRVLIE
jgi:L-threonylcarbamoyladenylate synthase